MSFILRSALAFPALVHLVIAASLHPSNTSTNATIQVKCSPLLKLSSSNCKPGSLGELKGMQNYAAYSFVTVLQQAFCMVICVRTGRGEWWGVEYGRFCRPFPSCSPEEKSRGETKSWRLRGRIFWQYKTLFPLEIPIWKFAFQVNVEINGNSLEVDLVFEII